MFLCDDIFLNSAIFFDAKVSKWINNREVLRKGRCNTSPVFWSVSTVFDWVKFRYSVTHSFITLLGWSFHYSEKFFDAKVSKSNNVCEVLRKGHCNSSSFFWSFSTVFDCVRFWYSVTHLFVVLLRWHFFLFCNICRCESTQKN